VAQNSQCKSASEKFVSICVNLWLIFSAASALSAVKQNLCESVKSVVIFVFLWLKNFAAQKNRGADLPAQPH